MGRLFDNLHEPTAWGVAMQRGRVPLFDRARALAQPGIRRLWPGLGAGERGGMPRSRIPGQRMEAQVAA